MLPRLSRFLFVFELYIGAIVIGVIQLMLWGASLIYHIVSLGVASPNGILILIDVLIVLLLGLLLLYGTFKVGAALLLVSRI